MESIESKVIDGERFYNARHVGKILGIKDVNSNIRCFNIIDKKKMTTKTEGGPQQIIYLSSSGIKKLILKSRKPNVKMLAEQFGIEIMSTKVQCVEADTLLSILQAFNGEQMEQQYVVGQYQVDLYFPKVARHSQTELYSRKVEL
jgi:hypothetical protein